MLLVVREKLSEVIAGAKISGEKPESRREGVSLHFFQVPKLP
jgi:hypothetical protein